MKLTKRIIKCIADILLVAMIVQTVSCGTLLYPERRQAISAEGLDPKGRQIDPAVAVMDAVCLLFFILPGVIAFAVDFSTGAIYLPGGKTGALNPAHPETDRIVNLPPGQMDKDMLSRVIHRETGVNFSFENEDLQAFEIDHPEDVGSLLVHFNTAERTAR